VSIILTGERRIAPRVPRSGRLEITYADPLPATVDAELIESSSTGFRASHACARLVPGLEVHFGGGGNSGRARVIWTHVLQKQRVSGFLLL